MSFPSKIEEAFEIILLETHYRTISSIRDKFWKWDVSDKIPGFLGVIERNQNLANFYSFISECSMDCPNWSLMLPQATEFAQLPPSPYDFLREVSIRLLAGNGF